MQRPFLAVLVCAQNVCTSETSSIAASAALRTLPSTCRSNAVTCHSIRARLISLHTLPMVLNAETHTQTTHLLVRILQSPTETSVPNNIILTLRHFVRH